MSVHSANTARLGMDTAAAITFPFTGTSVTWIGYKDEWSGNANVYIDGVLKATVDTYATPYRAQTTMYSATGLAAGAHTLKIVPTGTKNASSAGTWVWADAFDVGTAPATSGWTRIEETDATVAYTGTWSDNALPAHSGGTARLSMTNASKATVTFTGKRIRWIGYKDQWSGIAWVYVDGVKVATIDTYATSAKAQQLIYSSPLKALGTHTLTVYATGSKRAASGGAWVWADAFEVYR